MKRRILPILLCRRTGTWLRARCFSHQTSKHKLETKYDAIVVGAGHNGLVTAAYLQKSGLNVCVLEKRHVIGGAAVTEEIIPGFKFSRASYVLSLLRPQIYKDLDLKKYGLKVYLRDPSSYTPLLKPGGISGNARSLLLGRDHEENVKQIAQFSTADAQKFGEYEAHLEKIVSAMDPLLDTPPVQLPGTKSSSFTDTLQSLSSLKALGSTVRSLGKDFSTFYEFMTAPAEKILGKWFESEPLKATLATDSVIGAMTSPTLPGSGYVLLHHVMGEIEGQKGVWGYVEGGMGSLSQSIANCAMDHGTSIFTETDVARIIVEDNTAKGVVLEDGTAIESKIVLSNATPKITFLDLLPEGCLPDEILSDLKQFDFRSPVTKINVALKEIPNFLADPNRETNKPMPHHRCTIHINCEDSQLIHEAYIDAQSGHYSRKPVIEMVIPSSLDPTLAPPGCHVALLFTQYTPYHLSNNREWNEETKNDYCDLVFDMIEQYAPGFQNSVIGRDILTPPDLEKTFGLTGGNIFHGAMSLDQLYMSRPVPSLSNYRSPVKGLYLCGSGAHPGGGVMGAPGRIASQMAITDFRHLK